MTRRPAERISWIALHLLLLSVVAVYIFTFRYLPLQDFPQWIYHGHVFNQLVFHGNDFNRFFSLHSYVPPNASATVLIGLFELFAAPEIAGKIFVFVSIALIYLGSWSLLVALTRMRHPAFGFIAVAGGFSLFFFFGLLNFLFGLGIALIGAAYVVRRGKHVNFGVIALIVLLCYCSHFASLLVFCVPVIAMLFQHRRDLKVFVRTGLAVIPTVVLFIHYYFTKELLTFSSSGILEHGYFETMVSTYKLFPAVVMPFHRVKYVYDPVSVAEGINIAFAVLAHIAAVYFIVRMLLTKETTMHSLMGLLAALFILISPPYLGGLFFLGERFVYLFWLILFGYYFVQFTNPRLRTALSVGAFVFASLTIGSLWQSTRTFNALAVSDQTEHYTDGDARGGSNPFIHFHFYDDTRLNNAVPVFHSGLLDYVGAENAKPF